MVKSTKARTEALAEELLLLQPIVERYKRLEGEIKRAMVELEIPEINVRGSGRVFISTSERITISPDLAREVLSAVANKIIEVREAVSNKLVEALVKTGDITSDEHEQLLVGAKRRPVVSLHVRPLK